MASEPPEPTPRDVEIRLKDDVSRREGQRVQREMKEAEERGRKEAEQRGVNKDHTEAIQSLERSVQSIVKSQERLNKELTDLSKKFGEFAAVAKALAESGVTNKTFVVSVGLLLVAIVGLFLGVAHK